jgi:hypothetical protein
MAVGTQTAIIGAADHLKCKLLSGTLKEAALRWYINLPKNSIESWLDFQRKFIQQFSGSNHIKVTSTSIFATRQNHAETLREYLARFSEATIKVSNLNQEMFVSAFHNGLKAGHFNESLTQKPATSMQEIIKRVECYIKGEESNAEKRSRDAKERDPINKGNKAPDFYPQRRRQPDHREQQAQRKPYHQQVRRDVERFPQREYTPLNRARVYILDEILEVGLTQLPPHRGNDHTLGKSKRMVCISQMQRPRHRKMLQATRSHRRID